jgi:hypothetical protein
MNIQVQRLDLKNKRIYRYKRWIKKNHMSIQVQLWCRGSGTDGSHLFSDPDLPHVTGMHAIEMERSRTFVDDLKCHYDAEV